MLKTAAKRSVVNSLFDACIAYEIEGDVTMERMPKSERVIVIILKDLKR